jgi:hypothetical protein
MKIILKMTLKINIIAPDYVIEPLDKDSGKF